MDEHLGFRGKWLEGWVMYDRTIVVLYKKPSLTVMHIIQERVIMVLMLRLVFFLSFLVAADIFRLEMCPPTYKLSTILMA
jgi:hypothetical protein